MEAVGFESGGLQGLTGLLLPVVCLSFCGRDVSDGFEQASMVEPGWRWSVRLRECLVPYFFLLHRLDIQDKASRITLVEPELLKRYRFARKRG